MTLLTRFEKFYNRQYFSAEYLSDMPIVGMLYVIDIIAKLIDRYFPNAHLYARITKNRENPMSKSLLQLVGVTFVPILRGCTCGLIGTPIFLFITSVLKIFSRYYEDEQIFWTGGEIALFASFFIAFLIDYFFSIRHNKYEKYREEYLMEKTSHKVLWTLFSIFIVCLFFFGSLIVAALYSDKTADYIVSLIK